MAKQVRFDVEYNMGGAEQPGAPDLQVEGTEKKLPEGEEEDPTVLIGRRRLAANGRRAGPSPEPEQHTAVQDYLSSQLANLSGDPEQAETFKASIMGVAVGPADGAPVGVIEGAPVGSAVGAGVGDVHDSTKRKPRPERYVITSSSPVVNEYTFKASSVAKNSKFRR